MFCPIRCRRRLIPIDGMAHFKLTIVVATLVLFLGHPLRATTPTSQVVLDIDWAKFLGQHDLIWDRLPADYYEGAFVGNGLLGTIIFKDDKDPNALRFEIGRTDVYDHRVGGDGKQERARLPIGQLLLHPVGKITSAKLRCDLWNAEVRGDITTDVGEIHWRCFVPSDDKIILIQVTTTASERGSQFTFRPQQGNSPRRSLRPTEKYNYTPNPPFEVKDVGGMDAAIQPLLAGGDYSTAWKEVSADGDHRTLYLSVAIRTDRAGAVDDAGAFVNNAIARGEPELERVHRQWWHAFYPASFVSVPDPRIEAFYWIQWYKLASAAGPDTPAVDLMGPWFRMSVWSAYWTNLNIQLAYYTVQPGNHLELGEGLFHWIERDRDDLIDNCPPAWRPDSAALGNPTGLRLSAPVGNSAAGSGFHFIALPWLMQEFYLQYRYSMDEQRLRDAIYPLMRRTFNFYLRAIELGGDGRYHIPNAFSDEYGSAKDTSLNIALLRWGLQTLITASQRLKIADPLLPKWKDVLEKLVDYPTDEKTGILVGANDPFSRPHRHYSHLFAIFPLYLMNIDADADKRDLMEKSVRHFIGMKGDDCMFKFTGASSLFSAMGDGDDALTQLQASLVIKPQGPHVTPNTLYSENNWPTFESPISAARDVLDMLLQSWGGTIRVFPACPKAWKDASFHDLRSEGAFLVSAVRENGHTRFVRVKSLAGEKCCVRCDLAEPLHAIGPSTLAMKQHDGVIELKLNKGEEAILYSGNTPPSLIITPLPIDPAKANAWGVRSQ